MFHLFTRKSFSLSKISSQLVDQLYQTQRDRLSHTAAAEHGNHMGEMCLARKARLENELVEMSLRPAEKSGLFRRESIDSIVRAQLAATQMEYLDNLSQAEHHSALATMYCTRAARLRVQIDEMNPVIKSETEAEHSAEALPLVGQAAPSFRPSKAGHIEVAQPSWGDKPSAA